MHNAESVRGRAAVVQPGEAPSFWQPVPANGHADPTLTPASTGYPTLSMGYQTIAPGGRVREHSHGDQVELQICFRGRGHAMVDGVRHELVPGTACLLGEDVKHELINDGPDELVMLWVISPPGLERFFESIGRPRRAGDPVPEPFARPADVLAVERSLGMTSSTPPSPTSSR